MEFRIKKVIPSYAGISRESVSNTERGDRVPHRRYGSLVTFQSEINSPGIMGISQKKDFF